MLPKLKCHQNWNIIKTKISPKLKGQTTEISPKPKWHPKWNVIKTEMSQKLKCHQNWNVTKTEMSSNWNVTKTEMSQIQKFHKNSNQNQNLNPGDRHWSPWSCSGCNEQRAVSRHFTFGQHCMNGWVIKHFSCRQLWRLNNSV